MSNKCDLRWLVTMLVDGLKYQQQHQHQQHPQQQVEISESQEWCPKNDVPKMMSQERCNQFDGTHLSEPIVDLEWTAVEVTTQP